MSQRECAGSSETRSPVGARDPLAIAPRIASEACSESDVSFRSRVAQGAERKASDTRSDPGLSFARRSGPFALWAIGEAQGAARSGAPGSLRKHSPLRSDPQCVEFRASFAIGDGHEEEAGSLVRCAETATCKIDSPEGVTRRREVTRYNVEPGEPVATCNLLSKDESRRSISDEPEELGPEVFLIVKAPSLSSARERLARTRPRPDREIARPARQIERKRPAPDPCEKVRLRCVDVRASEIGDRSTLNAPRREVAMLDQSLDPVRREGIDLVVDVHAPES